MDYDDAYTIKHTKEWLSEQNPQFIEDFLLNVSNTVAHLNDEGPVYSQHFLDAVNAQLTKEDLT